MISVDAICKDEANDCQQRKFQNHGTYCTHWRTRFQARRQCAQTCGSCECKDTSPPYVCRRYVHRRQCKAHAEVCSLTCGFCTKETKTTTDPTRIKHKTTEKTTRKTTTHQTPALIRGVTPSSPWATEAQCTDSFDFCPNFAKNGLCNDRDTKEKMFSHCKKSCGWCKWNPLTTKTTTLKPRTRITPSKRSTMKITSPKTTTSLQTTRQKTMSTMTSGKTYKPPSKTEVTISSTVSGKTTKPLAMLLTTQSTAQRILTTTESTTKSSVKTTPTPFKSTATTKPTVSTQQDHSTTEKTLKTTREYTSTRKGTSATVCRDIEEGCASLVTLGFCDHALFKVEMTTKCAKSCGNCKSGENKK